MTEGNEAGVLDTLLLADELERIVSRERSMHSGIALGKHDCECLEKAAAALRTQPPPLSDEGMQ